MWLVGLRMGAADPRAIGLMRFWTGPVLATAVLTMSLSTLRSKLCSALATADFSVLLKRCAAFFGVKLRMFRAAETGNPWISIATCRALSGEMRAYLVSALTSIVVGK